MRCEQENQLDVEFVLHRVDFNRLPSYSALCCCFLALVFVAKVTLYLNYFWRIPEFVDNNLTEFYSREGFGFFVAEVNGRIVGCVGVQKAEDKVS